MDKINFSWFLTIPGMLITGGVLLLIVAIIIFIATGKSSKEMKNNVDSTSPSIAVNPKNDELVVEPKISMGSANNLVMPTTTNVDNLESKVNNNTLPANNDIETPVINDLNIKNFNLLDAEPVNSSEIPNNINNGIDEVKIEPIVEQTVEIEKPILDKSPIVEMPTINNDVSSFSPTEDEIVNDFSNNEIGISEPVINNIGTDNKTIYGGANPTVNIEQNVMKNRAIYGGANPLESTQSIPLSKIANNSTNNFEEEIPVASDDFVFEPINIESTLAPPINKLNNNDQVAAPLESNNNDIEML